MEIIVNGKNIQIAENTTVLDIIKMQNIKTTMFAVEKNLKIIPKYEYDKTILENGDKIEIVNFVGGG